MHSMQTTCPSSKSCRASWMSWSDRWWRFPFGTATTSPWKSWPSRLSYMTGIGKTAHEAMTDTAAVVLKSMSFANSDRHIGSNVSHAASFFSKLFLQTHIGI